MSKKQLLEESTVRKFMKLANIENLSDKFVTRESINESMGYNGEDEDELNEVDDDMEDLEADSSDEEMPDMGGDEAGLDDMGDEEMPDDEMGDDMEGGEEGGVSPEVAKRVVQAVLDALGVQGTVEDDEEGGMEVDMDDEEGGDEGDMEDMEDMEDAGDDDEDMEDMEDDEELNEDEEAEYEDGGEDELQESARRRAKSELVENVLQRVTARLVAEAKSSKQNVRDRMSKLKEEKSHIKTHKKQVGGLATKGKVKDKLYSKHQDMEYTPVGKGGKGGGKGGHEMKPQKSGGGKHTITHKKSSTLVSKGKNKHK